QETGDVFGRVIDVHALVGIARADVIEMRDLGADAAEIVPHAAQDRFDLGVALVREGRTQIVAADPVLAQPRPDSAHERAAEVADGDAIAAVDDGEQQRRDPSGRGVYRLLEAVTDDPAELRPGHDWIATLKIHDDLAEHLP